MFASNILKKVKLQNLGKSLANHLEAGFTKGDTQAFGSCVCFFILD